MSGLCASPLAAATPEAVHLLQAADGKRLARLPYGPSQMMATVAISGDGGHIALGWKRPDGKALVAYFTRGRPKPVWERVVGEGLPLVQMGDRAQWVAVGDANGAEGALLSSQGRVIWQTRSKREPIAVGLAPDGRLAAVAVGSALEVRDLAKGGTVWQGTVEGGVQIVRLAGSWLAALGTGREGGRGVRLWFFRLPTRG